MHLKEWLIAQIQSGEYEGLHWEDEDRTMFRIPWKHAAKKDYKQTEDAALFKAWAVYKGKYREGKDKADPTMWKTRLRCALNKSTDFVEVPERNQLDITEPYKVYKIVQDQGQATGLQQKKEPMKKLSPKHPSLETTDHLQNESNQTVYKEEALSTENPLREHMYCELNDHVEPQNLSHAAVPFFNPAVTISDFRMRVTLLYQGMKVMRVNTRSPDGCFILQGHVPLGNEQIYGTCTAQQLSFPMPTLMSIPAGMAETMVRLLCHLERGVLVWVAPDGVFIKRFCQGRVYWSGPLAQHLDRPNKLEREKTFKLLDVPVFLSQLQRCIQGKGPIPLYEIDLCFGEEYPDPNIPKNRKLIMAQVVPLFAEGLLQQFHLGDVGETQPVSSPNTERETEN